MGYVYVYYSQIDLFGFCRGVVKYVNDYFYLLHLRYRSHSYIDDICISVTSSVSYIGKSTYLPYIETSYN